MSKFKKFLITFFFGVFGIHKFIEGKKKAGYIYLFSLGIFGVGWTIDTLLAFFSLFSFESNDNTSQENNKPTSSLIKTINTKVVGVTFDCAKDEFYNRQDVIKKIHSFNPKFHLEPYEYNGEPANYVVYDKNGLDIGVLKAGLSAELIKKYSGCELKIRLLEFTGDDEEHKTAGCNIAIDVYKKLEESEVTTYA